MPTRKTKDENEITFAGIQELIRRDEVRDASRSNGKSTKAATSGKRGGLKGGPTKNALSTERRRAIAEKAARTRYGPRKLQEKDS